MVKKLSISILLGILMVMPFQVFAARTDGGMWDQISTYIQTNCVGGCNVLINGASKYLNFGTVSGTSGYGIRDNAGTIEIKNSGGSWATPSGGSQTPWTSAINGGGYALTNAGTITATNFVATSTTATSTFAGDVTMGQVSILNNNSGANTSLLKIVPTKTYGSGSQNQGDGALLVSCSSNNGLCAQVTRNNASAVAPLALDYITSASDAYTVRSIITAGTGAALTLSQTNSSASQATQTITNAGSGAGLVINMTKTTATSPGLRITATSTNASASTLILEQPFYVTMVLTDLSKNNAVGEGKFQLTNRNDNFRFEGRDNSNLQYSVSGLWNRPNSGGNFVWGGVGDIFSIPTGMATFNIVQSSGTPSYLNVTSTTTSASKYGDIFTILNTGNLGIGTTSPYAKLSVVGETVSSFFTATTTTATSTFFGNISLMRNTYFSGLIISNFLSGTTTKQTVMNDPDHIASITAANYMATYSDDKSRMIMCGTAAGSNIHIRNNGFANASQLYIGTTAQTITWTKLYNSAVVGRGCVTAGGYHYVLYASTTSATDSAIRRATSSDFISIAAGTAWATSTVVGLTGTTTAFLIGETTDTLWIATTTASISKFTIATSTNTLTYSGSVGLSGANVLINNTRVNSSGIYAGFSAAPFTRKYTLTGTAVIGVNVGVAVPSTSGVDMFATDMSIYGLYGNSTTLLSRMSGY